MRSFILNSVILGLFGVLVSCSGTSKPGPLTSTPPKKQIALAKEATWGGGLLKKYIFPTGVYTATEENEKGFYYSAPKSITVKDFPLTYGGTGGLYWEKGTPTPSKVYVKTLGQHVLLKPKTPLSTQ